MILGNERYKAVDECPGWYINERGEVWSTKSHKILTPTCNGSGYLQLVYWNKGSRKKHYIHRMAASTWIGIIPDKYTVNHIDGDKSNNNISNLEIVTRKENNDHAVRTGLRKRWRGELHPQAKLTEGDVRNIRSMIEEGRTSNEIARLFKVERTTIDSIKIGKTWSWLI